jgi:uncharacterized protein YqjF (DUF2071 family)
VTGPGPTIVRMTADQILASHQHRPWPLPQRRWVMRQEWHRLLFAHWAVAPERIRPLVPPKLEMDTRDGRCWVAVTPFYLAGLRARGLPALPGTSSFPELNVRTYVRRDGIPGVYFFSLDAGSILAVMGARLFYRLPYFHAHMKVRHGAEPVHYMSVRRHKGKIAEFEADYRPVGPPVEPAPGSLEQFLVERYCLYAARGRKLYRADIHHVPWSLQPARAEIATNTVAMASGIELPPEPPLLHFSRQMDVLVWAPERLA